MSKIQETPKFLGFFSMSKTYNPILSVDSVVRQGHDLVLDVSIDNDQFGIVFIENKYNWPTFVTNVKRVSRL